MWPGAFYPGEDIASVLFLNKPVVKSCSYLLYVWASEDAAWRALSAKRKEFGEVRLIIFEVITSVHETSRLLLLGKQLFNLLSGEMNPIHSFSGVQVRNY